MKDYYTILNVRPDASMSAIKQSYRKLAMKYHPDRNNGDDLSAMVFSEIAEAYNVLSDASARKNYNAQRYRTAVSEYARPSERIDDLLNKATKLKDKITNADPFRFNREALLYFIKQLFPANINALLQTDANKQKKFLETILWCSRLLASAQTKNLMQMIMPLFKQHDWMVTQFEAIVKEQTKKERWEKYKTALALTIALILCLLIFFITKRSR